MAKLTAGRAGVSLSVEKQKVGIYELALLLAAVLAAIFGYVGLPVEVASRVMLWLKPSLIALSYVFTMWFATRMAYRFFLTNWTAKAEKDNERCVADAVDKRTADAVAKAERWVRREEAKWIAILEGWLMQIADTDKHDSLLCLWIQKVELSTGEGRAIESIVFKLRMSRKSNDYRECAKRSQVLRDMCEELEKLVKENGEERGRDLLSRLSALDEDIVRWRKFFYWDKPEVIPLGPRPHKPQDRMR